MLVRYKEVDTLKGDLAVTVGPVTFFFYGEDTQKLRRATYHQYEHGRLPGAFKYGSSIAILKSTALAQMWADAIKGSDAHRVQLMELRLQLKELSAALSDCGAGQVEVAKLGALIDATQHAIGAALEVPPSRINRIPDKNGRL